MKKFQKDLNNSTFMYQGRTVTASNHTTDHKKKNVTLKSLGIGNKSVSEMNAKSTCTCMYLFFIQLNVHEAASLYKWPVIKVVQCIVLWTSIEWPTLITWPLAGTPRLAALWRFYRIICSWWFWRTYKRTKDTATKYHWSTQHIFLQTLLQCRQFCQMHREMYSSITSKQWQTTSFNIRCSRQKWKKYWEGWYTIVTNSVSWDVMTGFAWTHLPIVHV